MEREKEESGLMLEVGVREIVGVEMIEVLGVAVMGGVVKLVKLIGLSLVMEEVGMVEMLGVVVMGELMGIVGMLRVEKGVGSSRKEVMVEWWWVVGGVEDR